MFKNSSTPAEKAGNRVAEKAADITVEIGWNSFLLLSEILLIIASVAGLMLVGFSLLMDVTGAFPLTSEIRAGMENLVIAGVVLLAAFIALFVRQLLKLQKVVRRLTGCM